LERSFFGVVLSDRRRRRRRRRHSFAFQADHIERELLLTMVNTRATDRAQGALANIVNKSSGGGACCEREAWHFDEKDHGSDNEGSSAEASLFVEEEQGSEVEGSACAYRNDSTGKNL
jgi:hypothetical protein